LTFAADHVLVPFMPAAFRIPAHVSPEALRTADLLEGLSDFCDRAAETVSARIRDGMRSMEMAYAFNRLLVLAAALLGLAMRIGTGRGFPKPRPRPEGWTRPERHPLLVVPRVPFFDLVALQLPEAEALRARLAELLADPELAGLIAAEPAAWRAAARLARLFRLPAPPRPRGPGESEPAGSEARTEPRRRPPRRPKPPVEYLRPQVRPQAPRPQAMRPDGADPPSGGG
jgi:hypothetical protein